MANFTFYFASCLLLLALGWRASTGLPVPAQGAEEYARCSLLFADLLRNLSELPKSDVLCFGITSDKVVMSGTETLQTCAPTQTQTSGCTMQSNSSFSESECLRNIMKDLTYYDAAIKSYMSSPLRSPEAEGALLRPTLEIIESLKNCSLMPKGDTQSLEEAAQMWGSDTYTNRQEMCKMMRGFHVRIITINRAMGYISSGDHKK